MNEVAEDAFYQLWDHGTVQIGGPLEQRKSNYIQLFKRYKTHYADMDATGYIGAKRENTTVGVVHGEHWSTLTVKQRRKRYTYEIVNDQTISADLASNQEVQIQHGTPDTSSQIHAEDSHPSSAQGEKHGRSNDEEDWGALARAFCAESDPVPQES